MKNPTNLIIVAILLISLGAIGWFIGAQNNQPSTDANPEPASSANIKQYQNNGVGMEPTLSNGATMLVDTSQTAIGDLQRLDIIVFKYPNNPSFYFVKRIIGLPGDKIMISDSKIYINEQIVEEAYPTIGPIRMEKGMFGYTSSQLANDEYFVLGDNRPNSSDSRLWGPVKRDLIVGKFLGIYKPNDN